MPQLLQPLRFVTYKAEFSLITGSRPFSLPLLLFLYSLRQVFFPVLLFAALVWVVGVSEENYGASFLREYTRQAQNELKGVVNGKTVAIISPHLRPLHAACLVNRCQYRFPMQNLAYLATEYHEQDNPNGQIRYLNPEEFSPASKLANDSIAKLFERSPPDIVLVDRGERWPMKHIQVDYLQALQMDDRIKKAWQGYSLAKSCEH